MRTVTRRLVSVLGVSLAVSALLAGLAAPARAASGYSIVNTPSNTGVHLFCFAHVKLEDGLPAGQGRLVIEVQTSSFDPLDSAIEGVCSAGGSSVYAYGEHLLFPQARMVQSFGVMSLSTNLRACVGASTQDRLSGAWTWSGTHCGT